MYSVSNMLSTVRYHRRQDTWANLQALYLLRCVATDREVDFLASHNLMYPCHYKYPITKSSTQVQYRILRAALHRGIMPQ